jgi:hypothetical protein
MSSQKVVVMLAPDGTIESQPAERLRARVIVSTPSLGESSYNADRRTGPFYSDICVCLGSGLPVVMLGTTAQPRSMERREVVSNQMSKNHGSKV